jgi:energy-coupling factor transport system ATP-binding protein
MSSHRLEKLYKIASKIIYLDSGRILEKNNKLQLYERVNDSIIDIESKPINQRGTVLELKTIKFSYDNNKPILKNISLCIREGEVLTILGENGAGKTTFLKLLVDLIKPNEGKILKTKDTNFFYISQNTNLHFLFDTVKDELLSINNEIEQISKKLGIEHILNSHPLDISIGEQQKVLLAMAILSKANIIILDEPTKALDEICRIQVGEEIERLKNCGVAIIMATHDIDFAKRYSDRNMLLFDGELINL